MDKWKACSSWAVGCTLDDILWHQALVALRQLNSDLHPKIKELPTAQWVLYQLLHHGVVDPRPRDPAFNALTRVMCYSAVVTDRVWALLDKETTRVCFVNLLGHTLGLTILDRGILLSPGFFNREKESRTSTMTIREHTFYWTTCYSRSIVKICKWMGRLGSWAPELTGTKGMWPLLRSV